MRMNILGKEEKQFLKAIHGAKKLGVDSENVM